MFFLVRRKLSGCVCFGFAAGLLLHQVVDTETASGQQAVLSAGRRQQTQVSSAHMMFYLATARLLQQRLLIEILCKDYSLPVCTVHLISFDFRF